MADIAHDGGHKDRARRRPETTSIGTKFAKAWRTRPVELVTALMPAGAIVIGGITLLALALLP